MRIQIFFFTTLMPMQMAQMPTNFMMEKLKDCLLEVLSQEKSLERDRFNLRRYNNTHISSNRILHSSSSSNSLGYQLTTSLPLNRVQQQTQSIKKTEATQTIQDMVVAVVAITPRGQVHIFQK